MRDSADGAATELVLDVFKVNGLLLAAGDDLAGHEGLTSARWQVLGAIALAGQPLPVPRIARQMGLTRQSVQASVNRLVADGMLTGRPNDEHSRSPLFDLSDRGAEAYRRLTVAQERWISELVAGLSPDDLRTASRVLRALSKRLGSGAEDQVQTDTQTRTVPS